MNSIPEKLYLGRFTNGEREMKKKIWKCLCSDFLHKFIPADSVVVDMGAGSCEFINTVKAREKIAIDKLSISRFADKNVKIFSSLDALNSDSADIIFMSNFLEHLPCFDDVATIFSKAKAVLKHGGKIIIMGPNIRFTYKNYWNFIDHQIALSDLSLLELLPAIGFRITKRISRFMPFTVKSRYPKWIWLIRVYLKANFLWVIFGKQYLIICEKIDS